MIKTITTVTCDGCGASRSMEHCTGMTDDEPLWYRIELEFALRKILGQQHRLTGRGVDACCQACVHKALAKVAIPAKVAILAMDEPAR